MKRFNKNISLFFIIILLIALPFMINPEAAYEGSDGMAEEMITEIAPDYRPWAKALWQPPSGEVESLLFSLQAALGTGVIAYYLGYRKGKKDKDHVYHR